MTFITPELVKDIVQVTSHRTYQHYHSSLEVTMLTAISAICDFATALNDQERAKFEDYEQDVELNPSSKFSMYIASTAEDYIAKACMALIAFAERSNSKTENAWEFIDLSPQKLGALTTNASLGIKERSVEDNAYHLIAHLIHYDCVLNNSIPHVIAYIEAWCKQLDIDLAYVMKIKMCFYARYSWAQE